MVITDDLTEPAETVELLLRTRQGDMEAFCHLIEPLQTRLLRQAAALAGDLGLAEDLVSETLMEAWKSLGRYNESCRLSTWLYAILLHRYRKAIRRARSRPIVLMDPVVSEGRELRDHQDNTPSTELSPADAAAQKDVLFHLQQCIDHLSERHRKVILLRFFEDASLQDIAAVLGCSVGTVKSRLHHALEKLRKMKMNLPDLERDKQV